MDYQEILEPVAQYRDHLKAEHAENTSAAFEELLAQSGVDEALNVEKVKNIPHIQLTQADAGNGAFREIVDTLINDID